APAETIYRRPRPGSDARGYHHGHREGRKDPDRRQAETVGHRGGEDGGNVIARCPGDRLRDPEGRNDAFPLAGGEPVHHETCSIAAPSASQHVLERPIAV